MRLLPTYVAAFVVLFGLQMAPAEAANPCNPCNPCAMKHNPCNPCSMKKMKKHANPCNPCGMKKSANPCNPCAMNPCSGANPCSAGNTPIRKHAFDNFQQAADAGKKMWGDESLGTAGVSCLSCHADHELLNLGKNQNFPHYVNMVGDVVTLDQMINYCMVNPMKGKQFDKNSKELTAMAAYFRAYRMQYLREHKK
ncbi:MAG: hypothetical protein AUJ57_08185 [Zetaproteobacteria bacterium CG1_02_53_45]|nr:MAG: hypothetical protein AUJ57_08185 [Zetaproteobacteria bacterium CG1_02_53_45]